MVLSLLAWSTLVMALIWLVRDALILAGIEVSYQTAARWASEWGDEWLGRVIARVETSRFEQGQIILSVIAIAYGFAQIVAAIADRRAISQPSQIGAAVTAMHRLVGLMFARPQTFVSGTPTQVELTLHFVHGREMLFSPLRVGLWLFPVLGFLGTIIGISAAIEKLPDAMRERGAQLTGVVNELHFAFDTTFLGLIAAIVLMFMTAIAASLWERNEVLSRS